jgi:hypothetical protein
MPHAALQGRLRFQADVSQLLARTFALLVGIIPKLLHELFGRGSRGIRCRFFGPRRRGEATPRGDGQDLGKTTGWAEHQADSVRRLVAAIKERLVSGMALATGSLFVA